MPSERRSKNGQMSFFGGTKQTTHPTDDQSSAFTEAQYEDGEHAPDIEAQAINIPSDISENTIDESVPEVAPEHNVRPHLLDNQPETAVQVRFDEAEPKRRRIDFNYENSIILTFFAFLGATITRVFKNSFTVAIFTAYQRTASLFKESFFYKLLFNSKTERYTTKTKKQVRKVATNAIIPTLLNKLYTALMLLKVRAYALILLSFGLTTILVHFFISNSFEIFNIDVYAPITASILIIASLFLLSQGKSLSAAVKDSFILSTLLFGFLGIKHPSFNDNDEVHFPVSGGLLFGLLLGALTLFFPAHRILIVILAVIYTMIVVKYPETGLISLILIIPILNNHALVYICLVITVSYIFKILTGKRTPHFEFSDIFTAIFLVLVLLSEFFTYGDMTDPLMSSAFILVYFVCICTLRDPVWFDRAINAVMLDACIFSAYSIIVTFLGMGLDLNVDYTSNTDFGSASASAFGSVSVLSVLLVCSVFYMLSSAFSTKSKSNRFGIILLSFAAILFIFREASIVLKFAFLIVLILFLLLKSSKFFIAVILSLAIIPLLPLFNNGIYNGIIKLVNEELYRFDIWNAVITMLTTFGFIGIGSAPNAFSKIYASFYVGNSVTISHAHSLIFQLTISLGFIGIFLFAIIVFFILQGAFSYGRNCPDKNSKNRMFCYAGMCSVLAITCTGIAEHIWYNPRIALFFWLFCGLTVCARRSANDLTASAEILLELEENYNG